MNCGFGPFSSWYFRPIRMILILLVQFFMSTTLNSLKLEDESSWVKGTPFYTQLLNSTEIQNLNISSKKKTKTQSLGVYWNSNKKETLGKILENNQDLETISLNSLIKFIHLQS
jgi:hypothetical protein